MERLSDINKTADFFDSYASDFNAIYGTKNALTNRIINKLFRKTMRLRFDKTIEACQPLEGKSVLDIGCGPGQYGITLAVKGAGEVTGLDFAESMIELAERNAEQAGVASKCRFVFGDFANFESGRKYDYTILMGLMDYIENHEEIIKKALSVTKTRAFFSFPANDGFLAWQRKIRYRKRCPLYMYTENQLKSIFDSINSGHYKIERLSRDFFVTVDMK